jgi:hypothetical protein
LAINTMASLINVTQVSSGNTIPTGVISPSPTPTTPTPTDSDLASAKNEPAKKMYCN